MDLFLPVKPAAGFCSWSSKVGGCGSAVVNAAKSFDDTKDGK